MTTPKKNEQGYAMILVLLLIVIITISSATFMRAAISNAKQERIVDSNNLSVVAAEMGVHFYTTYYINKYNMKKEELTLKFMTMFREQQKKIESDKNIKEIDKAGRIKVAHDGIRNNIGEELRAYLNDLTVPKDLTGTKEDAIYYSVKKLDFTYNNEESIVHIGGIILGDYKEGKSAPLNMYLSFAIPNLLESIPNGNVGEVIDWNWHESIKLLFNPKPKNLCTTDLVGKTCLAHNNIDFKKVDKTKIYFQDEYKWNNNELKDAKNSIFYFEEEVEMKNMNNIENITIVTQEDFEVKQLGLTNSKVYVGEDLDIEGKIDLSGSLLEVKGNLEVENKVWISKSIVFIHKDFEVDNKLDIVNGSKVCVAGEIDVKKGIQIHSSSKLYILHENKHLKDNKGNYKPGIERVFSLKALQDKCKAGGTNDNNTGDGGSDIIKWDDPIIDVDYNY